MHVLGRSGVEDPGDGAAAALGRYRARDGSSGARVALDVESPHVGLVVGKRGAGKSYTLGVLAEELAATAGVAPVVVDPMGVFGGLSEGAATVYPAPRVAPAALPARAWPALFDCDPTSAPGALLWRAARDLPADAGLQALRDLVADAAADRAARRAADNYLALAASWDVFDPDGLEAASLLETQGAVLDCAGLDPAPVNALVRVVADSLYRRALASENVPLPWLLVDEAHAFDGTAGPALRRLLTRGRAPGVSLVLATQRPSALPPVAVSQSDLLVAHRLTAEADLDALAAARPTYLQEPLAERLPERRGAAVVVDDATETVHAVRVRERDTPHGGSDPRASERCG